MTNIIFWTSMVIVHVINARVWKDKPTSFWYKLAWFFIGWSALGTLYAISEYVSH